MRNFSQAPPFSPRAEGILKQALQEALRLRNNEITSEHTLPGIFCDEPSGYIATWASRRPLLKAAWVSSLVKGRQVDH